MPRNNGQKRRAAKAERKTEGKKVPYNPGINRKEKRFFLYSLIACDKCGDRMLRKNLPEHIRKARLHA